MLDPQIYRLAQEIYEERLREAELERSYREPNPRFILSFRLQPKLEAFLHKVESWLMPHHHTPHGRLPMGGAHGHA